MSTITLTNTLTNATTADADEVMENFEDITNEVNGGLDGDNIVSTATLSIATITTSGNGTIGGTLTTAGITTGSTILSDTDNTDDLGSSSVYWKDLYIKGDLKDATNALTLTELASGWMPINVTCTYASASTFTIAADVTGYLSVGMKLKLTQTTAKYFYISAIAYSSPNTTVTVNGWGIYTLANAAITLPFYSTAYAPLSFPMDAVPGYVKVRAYMSADQDNLSATTWTKVSLNAESYDTSSDFDAASTYGFTAPVTGYYRISGTVFYEATDISSGEDYDCAIYKDPLGGGSPAVAQYGILNASAVASTKLIIKVDTSLLLTATDIIYLYAWTSESDADIESGATNTSLSIELISIL